MRWAENETTIVHLRKKVPSLCFQTCTLKSSLLSPNLSSCSMWKLPSWVRVRKPSTCSPASVSAPVSLGAALSKAYYNACGRVSPSSCSSRLRMRQLKTSFPLSSTLQLTIAVNRSDRYVWKKPTNSRLGGNLKQERADVGSPLTAEGTALLFQPYQHIQICLIYSSTEEQSWRWRCD